MRRAQSLSGTFSTSASGTDIEKVCDAIYGWRRAMAMASTKVSAGLAYQAAVRWMIGWCPCDSWAARAIQENKPISMFLVRAMARPDHRLRPTPGDAGGAPGGVDGHGVRIALRACGPCRPCVNPRLPAPKGLRAGEDGGAVAGAWGGEEAPPQAGRRRARSHLHIHRAPRRLPPGQAHDAGDAGIDCGLPGRCPAVCSNGQCRAKAYQSAKFSVGDRDLIGMSLGSWTVQLPKEPQATADQSLSRTVIFTPAPVRDC